MIYNLPPVTRGLLFLFVIALFAQCEEDEPSTEATIETTMELQTNAAMQGKLTIEQASIHALQIDMVAKRTDGNQFTFSQANLQEDKRVRLNASDAAPFNISAQQGKYDPIEVTLTLQQDPYTLIVAPGTAETPPAVADYGDFLVNGKPSVTFSGRFNNRGQSTRVLIALNIADRIRMQATQLGTTAVSISKENRARFFVDPSYILQDITTTELESAVSFDYRGERVIFIHQDFNDDLYEQIIDRMFEDQSAVRVDLIEIGTKKG